MKDFISTAIQSARKEERKAIGEMIEGMKKTECFCHRGGGYYICCKECEFTRTCGWNQALTDLLEKLKERK